MRTFWIFSFSLITLLAFESRLVAAEDAVSVAAEAQEDEDKLSMFRAYTGKWHSVVKGKATDIHEKPYETTSDWQGRYILGGDTFEFSGTATTATGDTYEYVWLKTYDRREESYVAWYHDSNGVHLKHDATWDAGKRIFTAVPTDQDELGIKASFITYLVDDKTMRFRFKLVTNDGAVIVDESGEAKPKPAVHQAAR